MKTTKIEKKQCSLAEAKAMTADLKRDFTKLETGWIGLGKKGNAAIGRGVLHALGLNKTEWISQWASGEAGRTKGYEAMRAVRELMEISGVKEADVAEMGIKNAIQLAKLPEAERKDESMIRRAKKQSTGDFAAAIKAKKHGQPLPKENWRTIAIRTPESIADMFDEGILIVAKDVLDIDLEANPQKRIEVWEAIAVLLTQTHPLLLKREIKGLSKEEEGVLASIMRTDRTTTKDRLVGRETEAIE